MLNDREVNPIWDKRKCPGCCSPDLPSSPNSSAINPAEFMSWETVRTYFIGLRSDQVFFSYYKCTKCGLLYCPWYFNSEQISELYAAMPDNTMGEDKSTVSKTQSGYAKWIMRKGVSNSRYLEIGPDIGLVAKEMVRISKPHHITFLEPNHSVHEELVRNVSEVPSIEVLDFTESVGESKFSLIVGVHVYDHLLNPLEDLIEHRKKVSRGGHLAIVVHNEKSILRYLLRSHWPPFCLQHPQLYNLKSLQNILKSTGWEFIDHKKTRNWYHLKHFVKMGAEVLGLPLNVARFTPNIEIPIKLGNVIILARAID